MKIDQLIRDDEPIISCLIIPRKGQGHASVQADTQNLGIPFKVIGLDKAGLHIEVEQGKIVQFLKVVFDPNYYDKYSFHLEKDADDEPPEPLEQTEHSTKRLMAKEKEMKKIMQVRKPLRKPLQKTSESFDPSKLTPEDVLIPVSPQMPIQEAYNPTPAEKPAQTSEPQDKVEAEAPKPDSNPSKSKQSGGGRKPIGGY